MSKRFSDDFKQTIVDLNKSGKSPRELSKEYGIGYSTILKWTAAAKPLDEKGLTIAEQKKILHEKAQLKEENEILKKALGLFAREK